MFLSQVGLFFVVFFALLFCFFFYRLAYLFFFLGKHKKISLF